MIQSLLLNYAECLNWPNVQIAGWTLADKYQWKVFINLASAECRAKALDWLRRRYQAQQELAG